MVATVTTIVTEVITTEMAMALNTGDDFIKGRRTYYAVRTPLALCVSCSSLIVQIVYILHPPINTLSNGLWGSRKVRAKLKSILVIPTSKSRPQRNRCTAPTLCLACFAPQQYYY